jgi:hypothetical protein
MNDEGEPTPSRFERRPKNGPYRGRLTVRTVARGVSGVDPELTDESQRCINLGCTRARMKGARLCPVCAANSRPRRQRRHPVCSLCGGMDHNRQTCTPQKWPKRGGD